MQNNDNPELNKTKAISFEHVQNMIKNFYQLCSSFESPVAEFQQEDSIEQDEYGQSFIDEGSQSRYDN